MNLLLVMNKAQVPTQKPSRQTCAKYAFKLISELAVGIAMLAC